MKDFRFGTNFAIFIIFFGAGLIDVIMTQDLNWPRIAVYGALAALSLWADRK